MAQKSALVVEDEVDIAELVRYNLELKGYSVKLAHTGEDGLLRAKELLPNIVILDIMLPGRNGLEVCKALKAETATQNLPIIMVSARGEEGDIVKGLELGADDYVTKPFSPKVLLARVEAVLRRKQTEEPPADGVVKRGPLKIDPGRVEVTIGSDAVDLTQSEFRILHFLAQRPGWVYTRGQIVQAIHGENYSVTDRTIDFQMVGLRKKLREQGELIETVRGVGYRFKDVE
jgi:two-component system, OmpR family, alkaline phosphatase synthesis response regulator PhoP